MTLTSQDPADAATIAWRSVKSHVGALGAISAELELLVGGESTGVLRICAGHVEVAPAAQAEPLSTIAVDSDETLIALLAGVLHPFVALLQGRLQVTGERTVGLRVLFGLQAGSPWRRLVEAA